MSPTGDLLVTSIFLWGGLHSSLLSVPRVLRWHGTSLVAAHPSGVTQHMREASFVWTRSVNGIFKVAAPPSGAIHLYNDIDNAKLLS